MDKIAAEPKMTVDEMANKLRANRAEFNNISSKYKKQYNESKRSRRRSANASATLGFTGILGGGTLLGDAIGNGRFTRGHKIGTAATGAALLGSALLANRARKKSEEMGKTIRSFKKDINPIKDKVFKLRQSSGLGYNDYSAANRMSRYKTNEEYKKL